MFACESLQLVGETYANSSCARRACEFLLSHQREDGGWGESFKSCELEAWVDHEQTQVVGTCWAALALMNAEYPHPKPIAKAVKLVMSRQLPVSHCSPSHRLHASSMIVRRMAAGRKKRSRGSSITHAQSRTRISSSRSQSGCSVVRISTWTHVMRWVLSVLDAEVTVGRVRVGGGGIHVSINTAAI